MCSGECGLGIKIVILRSGYWFRVPFLNVCRIGNHQLVGLQVFRAWTMELFTEEAQLIFIAATLERFGAARATESVCRFSSRECHAAPFGAARAGEHPELTAGEFFRAMLGLSIHHIFMFKYRNIPVVIDGYRFPSKAEGKRYTELRDGQRAGIFSKLERQVRFTIMVNGMKICDYVADFRYYDNERKRVVVEDVKGVKTPEYKLKKKLVLAVLGIEIVEIA